MSSSTPGVPTTTTAAVPANRRQKRMGPAPFASFEDLSDEVRPHLESPEDKNTTSSVVRLPGIREDITPCSPTPSLAPVTDSQRSPQFVYTGISLIGAPSTPTMNAPPPIPPTVHTHKSHPPPVVRQVSLCAPSAPRIDISRASSSSHHDSKESSPERELFDATQDAAHTAKVSLGFKEDGTVDLRSSTEELAYQDATDSSGKHKSSHKHHHTSSQSQSQQQQQQRSQSPSGLIDESYHSHQRKDSQSSELGLLCISGRTSRLSSIGSQGSAASGHSRISTASHLSVISGLSGTSRSPSPHKMLLETSFCGIKPNDLVQKAEQQYGTKAVEPEELEKLILKRQHDPTQAILAEGMAAVSPVDVKKKEPSVKLKTPPEKPARKIEKQPSPKSDITIKVEKPTSESLPTKSKLPKTIIAPSGVEYIYIPLKGPMPEGFDSSSMAITKTKVRETKSATLNSKHLQHNEQYKAKSKSASPSPVVQRQHHGTTDEPKYIRIKLKPDYMYSQEDNDQNVEIQKPDSLDLHDTPKKSSQPFEQIIQLRPEPSLVSRQSDNHKVTPTKSPKATKLLKEPIVTSKSPSPSLSRKSSFASLFKSRETMSPESPSAPLRRKLSNSLRDDKDRRRSRSKSRDRDRSLPPSSTESIDSKGKPKSVFSIFKSKTKRDDHPNLENLAHELKSMDNTPVRKAAAHVSRSPQRYNETQLQGESIRIPLHSPTYYEQKLFLQDTKTSSLDSQETVIEATPNKQPDSIIEVAKTEVETYIHTSKPIIVESNRQSSSSSDNIVFSTKLGSSNDLFTTKIPKDPKKFTENGNIHIEMAIVECNNAPSRLLIQERHQEIEAEQEISEKEVEKVVVESKPSTPQVPRDSSFNSPISRELSPSSDVSKGKGLVMSKSREEMEKLRRSPVEKEICRITTIEKIETPKTIHKDLSRPSSSKVTTTKESEIALETATISSTAKVPTTLDLRKSIYDDDYRCSSESEKESEKDFTVEKTKSATADETQYVETERTGLVMQQESFEDEFPYVPTTLPQERSVAIPIVPIKQRSTFEMKTCPIERPRSSTPINPSCLEDYCEEVMGNIDVDKITKTIEKLKISLPKDETDRPLKIKSPRRTNSSNWFDFTAMGIQQKHTTPQEVAAEPEPVPPPLPPKGIHKEWINFEEIPERRKPPKRIQTIPSRGHIDVPDSVLRQGHDQQAQSPQEAQQSSHQVVYTYVNPEDCKCECHEQKERQRQHQHHHHRSRDRERDTRDRYSREQERCGEMRTPEKDRKDDHRKEPSPVSGDDSPSADTTECTDELYEDELPLLEDEPDIDFAQASTSGIAKVSKAAGRLKLDVTVVNRRSIVSESSVDLSVNIEQPHPVYPDQILRTPFTSDLGVSSNRSSIISQDESQSPPQSQSPNAFNKST